MSVQFKNLIYFSLIFALTEACNRKRKETKIPEPKAIEENTYDGADIRNNGRDRSSNGTGSKNSFDNRIIDGTYSGGEGAHSSDASSSSSASTPDTPTTADNTDYGRPNGGFSDSTRPSDTSIEPTGSTPPTPPVKSNSPKEPIEHSASTTGNTADIDWQDATTFEDYCRANNLSPEARKTIKILKKKYAGGEGKTCHELSNNMKNLKKLHLSIDNNAEKTAQIKDIWFLQHLPKLVLIRMSGHNLHTLEPLIKVKNSKLKILWVGYNNNLLVKENQLPKNLVSLFMMGTKKARDFDSTRDIEVIR